MTKKSVARRVKDGLVVPEAQVAAIIAAKRDAQLLSSKFQTADAKYREVIAEVFYNLDLPVECGALICLDCGLVRVDGPTCKCAGGEAKPEQPVAEQPAAEPVVTSAADAPTEAPTA